MWSDDQVRVHARAMVDKGFLNPSAVTLQSYYKGCDWRFDKLRAFCEQEIKNYTQELLRNKKR